MRNTINVVFSSDNNYAQHMGVAIYSLLLNNREFLKVNIYVIDNHIEDKNKKNLTDMVMKFENAEIIWIDFEILAQHLQLNMGEWKISISSYARLFIGSILEEEVERVLYLDCDMLVQESLKDVWNIDMKGYVLAAVQDTVGIVSKRNIGLEKETAYFNAGMLLIDVQAWREHNIEEKCLDFINERNGRVTHHDQGVLNGIFSGNFLRLPVQYNLMTIHYIWKRESILKYFGETAEYYTEDEINQARKMPVILHFTPSFTSRPWCKDCKHPLKKYYWQYIKHTPWVDAMPQKSKDKWYVKIIAWKYRHFPV